MSQAAHSSSSADAARAEEGAGRGVEEGEVIDAVPVLAAEALPRVQGTARELAREARGAAQLGSVQAAVVAAGGFVAGAAVAGLVHRRHSRSPALSGGRAARALGRGGTRKRAAGAEVMQIVGTRTFLVDVHVLGTPGADR